MIPHPSESTFGEGTLALAAQGFCGPPEISALLAELGLPVAGDWAVDGSFQEEGYWLRAGADGLEVRGRHLPTLDALNVNYRPLD